MTSRDFCYWLQGYFEVNGHAEDAPLRPGQVECIRRHLALVFAHEIDLSAGDEKEQAKLNQIHNAPGRPTYRC